MKIQGFEAYVVRRGLLDCAVFLLLTDAVAFVKQQENVMYQIYYGDRCIEKSEYEPFLERMKKYG